MENSNITTKDVKKINKNRIYKYIYSQGQCSRQEIAEKLGLSLPTVNQNLKTLTDEHLICVNGNYDSTGGRKAQFFTTVDSAKVSISMNVDRDATTASVIDLRGNTLSKKILKKTFSVREDYIQDIYNLVETVIADAHISSDDVLGVGVTIPGILDVNNCMIINAPTMGVKNISLEQLLKYIKYPWKGMNNAKSESFAEYWYTFPKYDENFGIYLMLDDGVGGAYMDYNGSHTSLGMHNRSGEFGHMTLYPNGRKCFCGKNGCFESYVSSRNFENDDLETYIDNLTTGINNLYTVSDCNIVVGGCVAEKILPYKDKIIENLVSKCSFETDGSYFSFSKCTKEQSDTGAALTYIAEYIDNV